MSDEKFTQSSWKLVEGSESGHCCFEQSIVDSEDDIICELWSDHGNLISAAPDMYRALTYLIEHERINDPSMHRECEQALAKARGKNNA